LQYASYEGSNEDLLENSYDRFVIKVNLELYNQEARKKALAVEKRLEGTISEGG